MAIPCTGAARHWFSAYGSPGYRLPWCARGCGAHNPRCVWCDSPIVIVSPTAVVCTAGHRVTKDDAR